MANSLKKESDLKFNKQDFRELSATDNILNVWIYNYFVKHKPRSTCDVYSEYCEEVLKQEWCDDWGDFDFVIGKIKNCDKSFIDLNRYSEITKWGILDELIKRIKKVNNFIVQKKVWVTKAVFNYFVPFFSEMSEAQRF